MDEDRTVLARLESRFRTRAHHRGQELSLRERNRQRKDFHHHQRGCSALPRLRSECLFTTAGELEGDRSAGGRGAAKRWDDKRLVARVVRKECQFTAPRSRYRWQATR